MRRGLVEIAESNAARWEARWYNDEQNVGDRACPRDLHVFDAAVEALAWARSRASVVIVERATKAGYVTSFSAGDQAPSWNPDLAALDETAMLEGRPAPLPEGEFGWIRIEPVDGPNG